MKKPLILLGHLSLVLTAILAIIFYKERVLFVDPGLQVFEMIQMESFAIYVSRYSMIINQSLPLLAIKMGLSLKTILILYSISFVVIYYLCFIVAVYGFKNIAAGISIALAPIIIRLAFGHSISEAWLGVAYSAVFYAVLNYYHRWKNRGTLFIILFYVLIVIILSINYFIHPLTLFTVGFAIGFTYFNKKENKSAYIYIVAALVLIIYMYKFFFPTNEHDETFFVGIKNADKLLPDLFGLPLIQYFKDEFFRIYIYPTIMLLIAIVLLIRNKKSMVAIYSIFFCIFYTIIAALAFYHGDSYTNMESRYIPLIFFVTIPFVEAIKEKKRNYILISLILVGISFSFVNLIKQVKKAHTHRIELYEAALKEAEKYPERKFYIKIPTNRYSPNSWGSATETLLLSSLKGKENSRTIIFVEDKLNIYEGMDYFQCLYIWVPWYLFADETKMLNKKYFDLKCSKYRELPYPNHF